MAAEEQQSQFDIRRYLGIIYNKRALAIMLFLLILTAVTVKSYLDKNVYEAKSLVLIEKAQILAPLLQGMAVDSRSTTLLRTIRQNMLSRNIVEKVIKKLDLDAEIKNEAQYQKLIEDIQKTVTIQVQGTDLFEVSYQHTDPKKVRDIVNALVSSYIEENMGSARGDTHKALDFIQEQIRVYQEKLEDSDRQLREFKEKHPGVVTFDQGAIAERIRAAKVQLAEQELEFKGLSKEKESLEAQLRGEKPTSITFTMRQPSTHQTRLNEAKSRLNALLGQYTEMHPEVVKLKGEIAELERAGKETPEIREGSASEEQVGVNPIYQQIKERLAAAQSNIDMLKTRIAERRLLVARDEDTLSNIPKEQEELARLTRGREVHQSMYDTLMARMESARVSKAVEEADKGDSFRVVDPAILPVRPVKPNRVAAILLGFALGIAGAIAGPIGLDILFPTFHDVRGVEELLGTKVIGVVGQMRFGPEYVSQRKRFNWLIGASGVYVLMILLLLARELYMNLTGKELLF